MVSRLVLATSALLLSAPLAVSEPVTAITNVTVVDVAQGAARPGQTIVIEGTTIRRIDAAAAPEGATIVNGQGLFAIPGLIDSHVHYIDPDAYGRLMIAHGVTFVREMGNATDLILPRRDRLNSGDEFGPEMIATGAIVDGKPPVWPFSEAVETPDEGRAAVQKLKAAGVDQIKVYTRLKPEVYAAVVDEAKKLGLKAVGHVPDSVSLSEAIRAGQHSNEHLMRFQTLIENAAPKEPEGAEPPRGGVFASYRHWMRFDEADPAKLEAAVKEVAASGMVQCPTLVVMQGIASITDGRGKKDPRMAYVAPSASAFWDQPSYEGFARFASAALPAMLKMTRLLHDAGATLVVGSDLANPFVFAGSSVHDEMRNFQQAGLTPAEALRAATIVPARAWGIADRVGSIEPGKTASLVLLEADPLKDIANVAKIRHVFLRGKHFDRAALDALLAEAKQHATGEPAAADEKDGQRSLTLDLPGKTIVRGTYAVRFQQFDAGSEAFHITKTDSGYLIAAHNTPKGGMQQPSFTTMELDESFQMKAATWSVLPGPKTRAEYTRDGNVIIARATKGNQPQPEQRYTIPDKTVVLGPIMAADFMAVQIAKLDVGASFEGKSASFSFPDWQIVETPYTLTRRPDTTIDYAGKPTPVRLYASIVKTHMGEYKGESWIDERGIPLKMTLRMPFGEISMALQEE